MTEELIHSIKFVCDSLCSALENGQQYDESLCCVLEEVLLDGLTCDKDKLWNLLKTVSHHSQNEFLESMENLSSHAGFVRAWVRVTLNDGAICSALKLLSEDDITQQYYSTSAFIVDQDCVSGAIAILRSLDKHELNYVCNTVVLNHWRNESCHDSCFVDETPGAPDSPGFNRRYSVGNRLSVSCEEDEETTACSSGSSRTSSSTDIPPLKEERSISMTSQPKMSFTESLYSENPAAWKNSQSDVRLSSTSDLSNLPEEGSLCLMTSDAEERLQYFAVIANELGLSYQQFKCYSCGCGIGNQGQEFKVCQYDKRYYCRSCFGNYSYVIPCKLIYNWDHNKYRVSKKSFDFLTQVNSAPNMDISKLNVSLYNHVPEIAKVRDYRKMLHMSREYLVRCTNKDEVSYETIRKKLGTHQYYWDSPHLYSIADLAKVFSGQLQNYLKKIVQKCIHHVYCCKRCSSLGFICEYCQNPKIIFAFELQTTEQCLACSAVYHKSCKRQASCPKCVRKETLLAARKRVT